MTDQEKVELCRAIISAAGGWARANATLVLAQLGGDVREIDQAEADLGTATDDFARTVDAVMRELPA